MTTEQGNAFGDHDEIVEIERLLSATEVSKSVPWSVFMKPDLLAQRAEDAFDRYQRPRLIRRLLRKMRWK